MINFLHTYHPQSILVTFGPIVIHWYGLMLALGFLAGFGLLYLLFKKYGRDTEQIYTLVMYIVIPALIGARLYYIMYAWKFYVHDLLGVFRVWEGGLAIHGVLIGGILGLWLYARKYKESIWELLDLLAPCVIAGQIVGRWGNYFNQELHGTPTQLPWGIPIDMPPVGYENFIYFHPTFLYESLLNAVVLIILLFIHYFKIKSRVINYRLRVPKYILQPGNIFLLYIMLYSVNRFLMEFLRTDYSPIVFGIRWAQIISIVIFVGAILLVFKKVKQRNQ